MDDSIKELLAVNQKLLTSIASGDWETYQSLCDFSLTCFEPETRGQLVEGMEFHRFYFTLPGAGAKSHKNVTMTGPHLRLLGPDAAVISYVRLTQSVEAAGGAQTSRFEETRIWQRIDGHWKHVHFHRSANA